MCPLEMGASTLHSDFLWFSVVVSIYCKEFLDDEKRLRLSDSIMTRVYGLVLGIYRFSK